MKISWSPQAKLSYFNILEYLHKEWSNKEIKKFVDRTENTLKIISKNPALFVRSPKKDIHKGFITKQISLYYKINLEDIILLTFWNNSQSPEMLRI